MERGPNYDDDIKAEALALVAVHYRCATAHEMMILRYGKDAPSADSIERWSRDARSFLETTREGDLYAKAQELANLYIDAELKAARQGQHPQRLSQIALLLGYTAGPVQRRQSLENEKKRISTESSELARIRQLIEDAAHAAQTSRRPYSLTPLPLLEPDS